MSDNRAIIMDGESIKRTGGKKNDPKKRSNLASFCCLQLFAVAIFAIGVAGGICIGIYAYHGGPDGDHVTVKCGTGSTDKMALQQSTTKAPQVTKPQVKYSGRTSTNYCQNTDPVKETNYEIYVFAPLTKNEMTKAAEWLFKNNYVTTLNTPTNLNENFILYQNILPPNKNEVLAYLDRDGTKPKRFAKVTIQRGNVSSPDLMEYSVGPLESTVLSAKDLTKPGDINFNARPYDGIEFALMKKLLKPSLDILAPVISESFDGATVEDDLFIDFYNGPPGTTGKTRNTRWTLAFHGFPNVHDVDMIHIIPVSGVVENTGTNPSSWRAYDFYYLNQGPFRTAQDLLDAYHNDTIRKVKVSPGYKDTIRNRIFPKRDQSKPLRKNADKPGPRTYYPEGPRYEVHGSHVKWMDWSFDISGSQNTGPALFDIRFKEERIIYEHAVNDIALNYAMDSHAQNNIIYADATYGIMTGDTPTTIMLGVDCPEHGTVLNTSYWSYATQKAENMRTICIFEADGQEALWRHAGISFEAGLRNRYLVVRVPVVIGNYDYTFEFVFYLDGKIYTYAKASGYIQSSFWDEHNPHTGDKTRDAFGYRLSDYQTGPVHDHMFGFKVDMDIIDKNNTFQVIKWKAGPVLDALQTQNKSITKAPEYFIYNETRYIEWEKIENEVGIQHTSEQQFWLVVNEQEKNKWGVERGYQIAPLATGDQALKNHPVMKALSFTKYHCAVTKRKEGEQTLTSLYDVNRMDNPQHHLDSFIDGENILNEDIVNWVTVGFLHIPTTEDMPMTAKVETGFLIRPFNFFDRTASFDMPQHTETADHTLTESEPVHEACVEPKTAYCRFC